MKPMDHSRAAERGLTSDMGGGIQEENLLASEQVCVVFSLVSHASAVLKGDFRMNAASETSHNLPLL